LHGVDLSLKTGATVQDFLRHEEVVKNTERLRVTDNMRRHNVDIYEGKGSFVDGHTVKVEALGKASQLLRGDIILVATGSRPRRPDGFPEDPCIYDSDTILRMKSIPKSMVVIGGGVVGCEYACTFAALGGNVSLVHSHEILLPFLDRDISLALKNSMTKMGIKLLMPVKVESCLAKQDMLWIKLDSGETIKTDAVFVAAGRTSNTEALNLEAAKIIPDKHGALAVDANYQVVHPETREPVSDIYAAGDVIGAPALASTSMEQARFAMIKAFNLEPYKKHVAPILPYGIYTIPECSGAGKTEGECIKDNIDYMVGKASYKQNARGMIIGDQDGFLKLIFQSNSDLKQPMKLLGVHVIGEIASELVHIGVAALIIGAGHDVFIDTCFNYPTLGELYKYATYDAMGNRAKRLKSK